MNCSASIIYSNSWIGATSSVGSSGSHEILYTASAKGLFRINANGRLFVVTPSPGIDISVYVNSSNVLEVQPNPDPSVIGSASTIVAMNSGDVIGTVINFSMGLGSRSYDAYITIEQLQ